MKIREKITATYEREIENKPLNNIAFYGVIALLVFVITFFFGIRPTLTALAQNITYKDQLTDVKINMETKLTQVEESEIALGRIPSEVNALHEAIPNKDNLELFLSELVLVSSRSGFVLERVKKDDVFDEEIPVHLEFRGQLNQLPQLTSEIDAMDRFVRIESIRTQLDEFDTVVRMKIYIYTL